MSAFERERLIEQEPDFGMNFDLDMDFDINAAFQEALHSVATDKEIALDEKVRRMEVIVSEGTSESYRSFLDFRMLAAQMEMLCNHDHEFNQAARDNENLSSFMDSHKEGDGHNHDKNSSKNDEEIDPKTGKKKKKKRSWFGVYI